MAYHAVFITVSTQCNKKWAVHLTKYFFNIRSLSILEMWSNPPTPTARHLKIQILSLVQILEEGAGVEVIEFPDMQHGWTVRGDMSDPKVKRYKMLLKENYLCLIQSIFNKKIWIIYQMLYTISNIKHLLREKNW